MKVILCGYNWAGCKALDILISQGYNVFVFTHENPYHIPSLINLCDKKNIPCSTENISRSIFPFIPDLICSIYYRNIIKKEVGVAAGLLKGTKVNHAVNDGQSRQNHFE